MDYDIDEIKKCHNETQEYISKNKDSPLFGFDLPLLKESIFNCKDVYFDIFRSRPYVKFYAVYENGVISARAVSVRILENEDWVYIVSFLLTTTNY